MIYNEAAGGFLDTAHFMCNYYCENYLKTFNEYHYKTLKYLAYYYEAKELIGPLPMELQPFCYADYKHSSLIGKNIYNRNIKVISRETVDNYLHTKYYLSIMFKHWFPNYLGDIPKTEEQLKKIDIFALADKLQVDEDVRYRVAKVFDNFEVTRAKLIETFFQVYDKMLLFRKQYEDILTIGSQYYNEPQSVEKTADIYKTDIRGYDYSVVLMQALHSCVVINRKMLYYGINVFDIFGDLAPYITPESFAIVYRDPLRVRIIKAFFTHSELSYSHLAEILGEKTQIIDKHIGLILSTKIICISKSINAECYYKLNREYFKILSEKMGKTVENLMPK